MRHLQKLYSVHSEGGDTSSESITFSVDIKLTTPLLSSPAAAPVAMDELLTSPL